jgi:hypothetical protein
MARPARVIRPIEKKLSLPGDLVTQVELELYSQLESRVPHGAWSKLVEELLRKWVKDLPQGVGRG